MDIFEQFNLILPPSHKDTPTFLFGLSQTIVTSLKVCKLFKIPLFNVSCIFLLLFLYSINKGI